MSTAVIWRFALPVSIRLTYRTNLVINAAHRSVKAFKMLSIDLVNCAITDGLICSPSAVKAKTLFFPRLRCLALSSGSVRPSWV